MAVTDAHPWFIFQVLRTEVCFTGALALGLEDSARSL